MTKQSKVRSQNKETLKYAPKLRNHLMIVVLLLSLALLFGVMTNNFKRTYRNARNDVIELSKKSSLQNAESIETFFMRHEDVLLAAAEIVDYNLSKNAADESEVRTLLYNLSKEYNESIYKGYTDKDFTGIYASVNGSLIHAYKDNSDLPDGYDPTKRPWYKEGKDGGGKIVFGEPYYDVYDPTVKVMTVTKLLSDGETVIGMDITLKDIQYAGGKMDVSVTLNGKIHDYGHGFILTNQGIVMAHWDEAEQGKNYSNSNSPMSGIFQKIKECADSNEDYMETDLDGVDLGIFPQKLSNGWYVVTLTDFEDIRTTISDFAKSNFAVTLIVILVGTVYCFLILRAYVKLERLTDSLQSALTLAKKDALTKLGNRTAYDIRVRELREKISSENDAPFVLLMMDLNDLKYVNDHYGHSAGDQYILNSCRLVSDIFPCEIYRIGGDEFALLLTGEAFEHWEELFDRFKQTIEDANMSLTPNVDNPSLAVGLAIHTVGNKDDIDELLRKADAEMYTNKVAIKQNRLEHSEKGCSQDLKLRLSDKQMLASEMQKGLDEEEFEVWFQPQVNHENNGALIGAEALVRWKHPTRRTVSPSVFVPLFEYNGLIYELDKYVWRHACKCLRQWIDDGMLPLPISVNVSRLDVIQADFVDTIVSIVEEFGISHDLIHLEITESAFSDDTGKVVEIVKELIDRGFIIAIDDFGSGYSSLSLLRRLPAHIIKLDMHFLADGEDKSRNECIIESIIRMVKMLGMAVIAEGVEYKEQADFLHLLGCDYVQGYLYSKPLPYTDYTNYAKTAVNEIIDCSDNNMPEKRESESEQAHKLFHSIISGTNDVIIVTDNKTKQLLYANRAAEEFFGKRFDPLRPTTCMQYCEKREWCRNCPANDMKSGERREYVFSENGCHIKSLYTQMNWNGHDAVVIYQTDISAEVNEMEFANSLLNSLGVGIVIFQGETPDELIPIFCNKEYMRLSGLDFDGFKTLLTKNSLYGVHPEDIDGARKKFAEAFYGRQSMKCNVRVKKTNGIYEWVTMHGKIKHLETGGFEVYMIFADAQEEMQKSAREAKRYETYIARTSREAAKALSVTHFNLTENTCRNIHRDISVLNEPVFEMGLDEFIFSIKDNVANEETRAEFIVNFSTDALKANYDKGILTKELHLPIRLLDQRIIWCYQTANVSQNPATGDLEAVMTLTEADKDIRMEEYYRRILQTDYELIGCIDPKTGFVNIISETISHGLPKLRNGAVHYMENLEARLKFLVEDTSVDLSVKAISLDNILKELRSEGDYICSFPAKRSLMGENVLFSWRFGYVNASKTEILFSRKVIKDHREG